MTNAATPDFFYTDLQVRLFEDMKACTGPLNRLEAELAGALMARCTPLPQMPWPILRALMFNRIMPCNPVEVVVFDQPYDGAATPTQMLMTRRIYLPGETVPEAEFWKDHDHYPGKYLGGGEWLRDAITRVVKGEISPFAEVVRYRLITVTNLPQMVRNHDASLVFVVELKYLDLLFKPGVAFYPLHRPPSPLIPHHVVLYQRVVQWLAMYRRLKTVLSPEDFAAFDQATDLLESGVV